MDPDPQKMNADPQPCPDRSPVLRIRIFFHLWIHPEFDLIHLFSFKQCCGSASIIMQIRIRDQKNVHMDPDLDADPDPRG